MGVHLWIVILLVALVVSDAAPALARDGDAEAAPAIMSEGGKSARRPGVHELADYQKAAKRARRWLTARLGIKPQHPVRIKVLSYDLMFEGLLAGALTRPVSRSGDDRVSTGPFAECLIQVSDFVETRPWRYVRGALAHEMTHCFQLEVMGTKNFRRNWLVEGSAEWASYKYVDGVWNGRDWWDKYAFDPRLSLYDRTYDAVGFFAHIARRTGHPWRVIRNMWKVARSDSGEIRHRETFGAAQRAAGGAAFARTWATSFARRSEWGKFWEMRGPGLAPARGNPPRELRLSAGAPHVVDVRPASVAVRSVIATDGAVVRVEGEGYGTLLLSGGAGRELRVAGKHSMTYCVAECFCADGTSLHRRMPVDSAGLAYFAFTGGAEDGETKLRQLSVEEACGVATATPCDRFGPAFSPVVIAAWTKAIRGGAWPPQAPNPPEIIPPGFPISGGTTFADRGCMWLSNYGDLFQINEVGDGRGLRQHLRTWERVAVGDEGWIEPHDDGDLYYDPDVYFRVGAGAFATYTGVNGLDRDEAIAFARAVSLIARGTSPPCC